MASLTGAVERITFYSAETGYTVMRLHVPGQRKPATVVGRLIGVQVGETLELEGEWTEHAAHGRQFQATRWHAILPADIEGIRSYLGSGLIRGIGPVMAQRIVDVFGAETLRIIEERPRKLYEVPGIGRKRIEEIVRSLEEQRDIKTLMALLTGYGITPTLAARIYREYGEAAVGVVTATPYRLADEIFGIGFEIADQIAQAQGLSADDPGRIGAGLRHVLGAAAGDGHCYLPQTETGATGRRAARHRRGHRHRQARRD